MSQGRYPNRLKEVRKAAGKSPTEVAQECGVHMITIMKWESGARRPSLENLFKLAKCYGKPIEDLFPNLELTG